MIRKADGTWLATPWSAEKKTRRKENRMKSKRASGSSGTEKESLKRTKNIIKLDMTTYDFITCL